LAEAVGEIDELTTIGADDQAATGDYTANQWYNFACICAVASRKSADKGQEYADRAMNLLARTVQAGWKNADKMANDKMLEALRERDDFKKLVADLTAQQAGAKPKDRDNP
jgi:hypothetical protein